MEGCLGRREGDGIDGETERFELRGIDKVLDGIWAIGGRAKGYIFGNF